MAAGTPLAVGVAVPVDVVTGGRHGGGSARRNRRRSSSTGVDSAVLSSVRAAVEAELRDLLTHEIRDKIGREVESTVRPRIERELRSKFHTDLQAALKKQEAVRSATPVVDGSCELRDSSCVPCAPNVQELTKGDPQLRMEAEQLRAELESETKRRQLWQAVRRSSGWRWVGNMLFTVLCRALLQETEKTVEKLKDAVATQQAQELQLKEKDSLLAKLTLMAQAYRKELGDMRQQQEFNALVMGHLDGDSADPATPLATPHTQSNMELDFSQLSGRQVRSVVSLVMPQCVVTVSLLALSGYLHAQLSAQHITYVTLCIGHPFLLFTPDAPCRCTQHESWRAAQRLPTAHLGRQRCCGCGLASSLGFTRPGPCAVACAVACATPSRWRTQRSTASQCRPHAGSQGAKAGPHGGRPTTSPPHGCVVRQR